MRAPWFSFCLIPFSPVLSHVAPSSFRDATIDDIDDITTVFIEAFKPSPAYRYIRQFADKAGEEYTWTCHRDSILALFQEHAAAYRFQVVTVPEPTLSSGEKVVSASVWDFSQTRHRHGEGLSLASLSPLLSRGLPLTTQTSANDRHLSDFNCSAHLDMNLTRAAHYQHHMEDAERKYLAEPFGRQLYLGLLATHPHWDGNGFAARHLHWGKAQLELLRKPSGEWLPMTLLATPAGYPIYVDEGFTPLKNVTFERLDGNGLLWYEAMSYEHSRGEVDEL